MNVTTANATTADGCEGACLREAFSMPAGCPPVEKPSIVTVDACNPPTLLDTDFQVHPYDAYMPDVDFTMNCVCVDAKPTINIRKGPNGESLHGSWANREGHVDCCDGAYDLDLDMCLPAITKLELPDCDLLGFKPHALKPDPAFVPGDGEVDQSCLPQVAGFDLDLHIPCPTIEITAGGPIEVLDLTDSSGRWMTCDNGDCGYDFLLSSCIPYIKSIKFADEGCIRIVEDPIRPEEVSVDGAEIMFHFKNRVLTCYQASDLADSLGCKAAEVMGTVTAKTPEGDVPLPGDWSLVDFVDACAGQNSNCKKDCKDTYEAWKLIARSSAQVLMLTYDEAKASMKRGDTLWVEYKLCDSSPCEMYAKVKKIVSSWWGRRKFFTVREAVFEKEVKTLAEWQHADLSRYYEKIEVPREQVLVSLWDSFHMERSLVAVDTKDCYEPFVLPDTPCDCFWNIDSTECDPLDKRFKVDASHLTGQGVTIEAGYGLTGGGSQDGAPLCSDDKNDMFFHLDWDPSVLPEPLDVQLDGAHDVFFIVNGCISVDPVRPSEDSSDSGDSVESDSEDPPPPCPAFADSYALEQVLKGYDKENCTEFYHESPFSVDELRELRKLGIEGYDAIALDMRYYQCEENTDEEPRGSVGGFIAEADQCSCTEQKSKETIDNKTNSFDDLREDRVFTVTTLGWNAFGEDKSGSGIAPVYGEITVSMGEATCEGDVSFSLSADVPTKDVQLSGSVSPKTEKVTVMTGIANAYGTLTCNNDGTGGTIDITIIPSTTSINVISNTDKWDVSITPGTITTVDTSQGGPAQ